MIVSYKDLFWKEQQMEVTWILENIIQQYQYDISELKKELEDVIHAQNRIRAMYELTHPKTAHDAEELQKMEKILEKYYNQEKEMLIKQNTLLQQTNEELQNFILKQHKDGNKTNNQI